MSSNHFGCYMDGVPVKISEKFKPPPQITVPYGVIEQATASADLVNSIDYDFSLEKNVLTKLTEWRNAKESLRNERNHRLQLKEESRQRQLDLLAATETEERLKKLSVSEVSYPSTEEISEISPDDADNCQTPENVPTTQYDDSVLQPSAVNISSSFADPEKLYQYGAPISMYPMNKYADKTNCESVSNILQPTPVSPGRTGARPNLLDDPDPISQFQTNLQKKIKYKYQASFKQNNIDSLTYSDFENDTSSPFDNMELKTINDLELLAQVLNFQQPANSAEQNNDRIAPETSHRPSLHDTQQDTVATPAYSIVQPIGHGTFSPNSTYDNPVALDAVSPFSHPVNCVSASDGYYDSNNSKLGTYSSPAVNNGFYAPDYGYSISNTAYQRVPNMHYNVPNEINSETGEPILDSENDSYQRHNNVVLNRDPINPYDYYNTNYSFYAPVNYHYSPVCPTIPQKMELKQEGLPSQDLMRSRSRSVPDIVKELDEEVAGARLKARERSHNCSPAPRQQPAPDPPLGPSSSRRPPLEVLADPYSDLSPSLQMMCKHISSMGFPLDRVARACDEVGKDDKKIVEYLLAVGQLMDLGFPESKVAKALLQHDCNRDKALDELVS